MSINWCIKKFNSLPAFITYWMTIQSRFFLLFKEWPRVDSLHKKNLFKKGYSYSDESICYFTVSFNALFPFTSLWLQLQIIIFFILNLIAWTISLLSSHTPLISRVNPISFTWIFGFTNRWYTTVHFYEDCNVNDSYFQRFVLKQCHHRNSYWLVVVVIIIIS